MTYVMRHIIEFDHDEPNESRADYGSRIALCTPDWGKNDIQTDITDGLADIVHFIRRVGLDPHEVFDYALRSAQGDLEDGPEAEVDETIALEHLR